ncbi:DnaB-like helicase N-terminal domain-containing protein [Streptomyces sp. NPDC002122]|uniref:DnaB-like helicase N-terminal domain-containing protein n=1 Tax=Streptomyces sp. NPDC002122 TaxID=3154407 RepID=UPI0033285DAB
MPHAPEPSDEGLPYEPAEREPVHYAEQALLGAVLLKPELLAQLAGLESNAFFNPAHAALFSAMGAEPVPERPGAQAGLEWLRTVLEAARKEAPALTAAYLHLLISACPRTEHVEAYAAMVRGAHARRSHAEVCCRLAHERHRGDLRRSQWQEDQGQEGGEGDLRGCHVDRPRRSAPIRAK